MLGNMVEDLLVCVDAKMAIAPPMAFFIEPTLELNANIYSNKKLLGTSALLLVTRSERSNKCHASSNRGDSDPAIPIVFTKEEYKKDTIHSGKIILGPPNNGLGEHGGFFL